MLQPGVGSFSGSSGALKLLRIFTLCLLEIKLDHLCLFAKEWVFYMPFLAAAQLSSGIIQGFGKVLYELPLIFVVYDKFTTNGMLQQAASRSKTADLRACTALLAFMEEECPSQLGCLYSSRIITHLLRLTGCYIMMACIVCWKGNITMCWGISIVHCRTGLQTERMREWAQVDGD